MQRVALIGLGTMGPDTASRLAGGGLDVAACDASPAAVEHARAALPVAAAALDRLEAKTGEGKLGLKSGEGIYAYTPDRIAALQAERAGKRVAVRRILEGRG